jgi:hypothetical protein
MRTIGQTSRHETLGMSNASVTSRKNQMPTASRMTPQMMLHSRLAPPAPLPFRFSGAAEAARGCHDPAGGSDGASFGGAVGAHGSAAGAGRGATGCGGGPGGGGIEPGSGGRGSVTSSPA